jgi:hypothetical protein
MDFSILNERPSRVLAISAVFFSCFGGLWFGMSIGQVTGLGLPYRWVGELIFGTILVAIGIVDAVMLLRRTRPNNLPTPADRVQG